jgi:YjbR
VSFVVTTKQACEMARAMPNVSEQDHFGSDAFRTAYGIFATVWHGTNTVNLRLTPEQQQRFVAIDGEGFREIDNAWGRQGWTTAVLEFLDAPQFLEALRAAYDYRLLKTPRKKKS